MGDMTVVLEGFSKLRGGQLEHILIEQDFDREFEVPLAMVWGFDSVEFIQGYMQGEYEGVSRGMIAAATAVDETFAKNFIKTRGLYVPPGANSAVRILVPGEPDPKQKDFAYKIGSALNLMSPCKAPPVHFSYGQQATVGYQPPA